jgi:glycerol-3-phosphate O-acyltransferase
VTRLAHQVMSEINRVTAVTPGSLVATALLCHSGRGVPHIALVDQCARLAALLGRLGARTTPSLLRPSGELKTQSIRDAAVVYVRGALILQHVPGDTLTGKARRRARIYTGDDVIYTVPDDKRLLLDLSKNIIVHFFVDRALVSVAWLSLFAAGRGAGEPPPIAELKDRVQSLSRLFKLEFIFRADAPFEQIFEDTVADMIACGELSRAARAEQPQGAIDVGPGHDGLDGRGWVSFYAAVIKNFLEAYRIAARTARVLTRGPLAEKDLTTRALRVGEQMFLGGEIERAEAVSRTVISTAFGAFLDQGYLARSGGKLSLAESFASEEAAHAIEARIAGYLVRKSTEGW